MLEAIIVGGGFAFAAAVQPGPLQAFLLSRVAVVGWRRTLPAALAPLISDGPIAVLMLTVLHYIAHGFESFLRAAGGVVLLAFAIRAVLDWRRGSVEASVAPSAGARSLLQAVGVNLVNPGPWLGWSLILGPLVLESWDDAPAAAVVLVAAFYVVIVACLALFILAVGTTSLLGSRGRRGLLLASAVVLAGLGVYSLVSAVI